jgi:hypothetical protein
MLLAEKPQGGPMLVAGARRRADRGFHDSFTRPGYGFGDLGKHG